VEEIIKETPTREWGSKLGGCPRIEGKKGGISNKFGVEKTVKKGASVTPISVLC